MDTPVNLAPAPSALATLRTKQADLGEILEQIATAKKALTTSNDARLGAYIELEELLDDPEADEGAVAQKLAEYRKLSREAAAPQATVEALEPRVGQFQQEILTLKKQILGGA